MALEVREGDCLEVMKGLADGCADLVYLDPPFFTQRLHKLSPRDRTKEFSFSDRWRSGDEYYRFLEDRLIEAKRVLKSSGSIFFHCDHTASHYIRLILEGVFEADNFRSEIIWAYRRWSNSQRNLLPAHQTIFFFSKTNEYKFNPVMSSYSPSTNVDQILQKRERDSHNKAVYARDESGLTIFSGPKTGVPLSDVWDIPFLNPKASERIGYPTQKPILLLERIIQLVTDPGDCILDPFCGSGTALVAAALLLRNAIGIDISRDAVEIAKNRLANPIKSSSGVLEAGRDSYETASAFARGHLSGIDIVPVQRNNGIDAFLKIEYQGGPVPIRVQRPSESLTDAAFALYQAAKPKHAKIMILIATHSSSDLGIEPLIPSEVTVVDSTAFSLTQTANRLLEETSRELQKSQLA